MSAVQRNRIISYATVDWSTIYSEWFFSQKLTIGLVEECF